MAIDERVIGKQWEIPAPAHVGHTLTVIGRDEVEKHRAFWVRCSCGATTTMGEAHIEGIIADGWTPYSEADQRFHARPAHPRPPRVAERSGV